MGRSRHSVTEMYMHRNGQSSKKEDFGELEIILLKNRRLYWTDQFYPPTPTPTVRAQYTYKHITEHFSKALLLSPTIISSQCVYISHLFNGFPSKSSLLLAAGYFKHL